LRGNDTILNTTFTNFTDETVTAGNAYVYKVRALDASSRASSYGTPDVATTIFFTNDPFVAGTTTIQATHVTELRQAVNAVRAAAGMGAFSFTDASLAGVSVKTTHVDQLRTALTAARATLGLTTLSFTDPALSAGMLIKAAHFQELRAGVK
ncbi:MAG TPA: hypothetical protein VJZ00_08875, partial [Thermoanaerobaculia bacterium]|nr:hypothetical protein [Thermoanaerobaculia bacterium]